MDHLAGSLHVERVGLELLHEIAEEEVTQRWGLSSLFSMGLMRG